MEPGRAVILIADPNETTAEEVGWLGEQLLREDELSAVLRFVRTQDQHDHTVSRAFLRLGLSSLFPVAVRDWQFVREPNQKPFIGSPEKFSSVQFSLSHTHGAIALLVTGNSPAGVDVEKIEPTPDLTSVAERVFSNAELKELSAVSGEAWLERFFTLWTLKEAYAKARGLGMSLPLNSVSFEYTPSGEPMVVFGESVKDTPGDWQFRTKRISPTHVLSAAVRSRSVEKMELSLRRVTVRASLADCWIEPRESI